MKVLKEQKVESSDKIRVGDWITWGVGQVICEVLEIIDTTNFKCYNSSYSNCKYFRVAKRKSLWAGLPREGRLLRKSLLK